MQFKELKLILGHSEIKTYVGGRWILLPIKQLYVVYCIFQMSLPLGPFQRRLNKDCRLFRNRWINI